MAIKFNYLEGEKPMKVTSAKTWLLNADGSKALPEGSPAGTHLLVHAGCDIEADELEKYGLLPDGSDYAPAPQAEAEPQPETKKSKKAS